MICPSLTSCFPSTSSSFRPVPGSDSSVWGRQPVHGDHPAAPEEPGNPHPVHEQSVQSLWDARSYSPGFKLHHLFSFANNNNKVYRLVIFNVICEYQESRIGKAVEVMIQHVENLRRMYTKEHAELLELREALMQNERSFGSQTERGKGKRKCTWKHTWSIIYNQYSDDFISALYAYVYVQLRYRYVKICSVMAHTCIQNTPTVPLSRWFPWQEAADTVLQGQLRFTQYMNSSLSFTRD